MSIRKTLYEKDLYDDEELFQRDCAEIAKERYLSGEIDRRTFAKALAFIGAVPAFATLGGRSAKACEALHQAGITRVFNLEGGIVAWAKEIDTALTVY